MWLYFVAVVFYLLGGVFAEHTGPVLLIGLVGVLAAEVALWRHLERANRSSPVNVKLAWRIIWTLVFIAGVIGGWMLAGWVT